MPRTIVSDNGKIFISKVFQEFLRSNGILHRLSAPYNPRTNGHVEIYVNTTKQSLKKMCEKVSDVEEALLQVLMQYRIMPHITTRKTPSELIFGRKMRCSLDLLKPVPNVRKPVEHNNQIVVKSFKLNDRVKCRRYEYNEKWIFRRINKVLGK